MQSLNLSNSGAPTAVSFLFTAMVFIVPSVFMSMIVGNMLIGEEGQAVWRIYASPISPKNLVKSKFFFQIMFSLIILVISGIVGAVLFHPSLRLIIVSLIEDIFLILSLGSIALTMGFRGADFTVSRRARMIRQQWSLISLAACFVAGIGMLAPFFPYVIGMFAPALPFALPTSNLNLAISVAISGAIASVLTAVFYRINVGSAEELLRKAEV
jgi:hypothetical protein